MLNLKRILLSLFIASSMASLATYSTVASAAETGSRIMRPNKVIIKDVLKHLDEALEAVNSDDKEAALSHIQVARQFSKEISIGSVGAVADRAADAILRSKRMVKRDDKNGAIEALNDAMEEYKFMSKKTL